MRINRLDLLRYGPFTDVSLTCPRATFDLHLIFGPNEAGKSTSLAAIEDLLFGIPHNSPYNFVHDYGAMRVGGVLEHNGQILEFRRRKGNKDTLLTPNDNPLPAGDSALLPFLGGADREFLARMFSLNHQRLAQGGREILEAKDEVGQTLFSAGSGLSGLRERMASLDKEADSLWGPRKASHREYYIARDALEEAEREQREHTITARNWQEIKRALDAAEEAYQTLEQQFEETSTEQRRLSRIRRIYRPVKRLAEVEAEIFEIGEVPALPENAETQLTEAVQAQSDAQSKIDELNSQLAQAKSEYAGLRYDEVLLLRSDEISMLHQQRIEIQKAKSDLPKLRADLAVKEEQLTHHAEDLGWDASDFEQIGARIPQRAKISTVRALLTRRAELSETMRHAESTLEEAKERVRDVQSDLDQLETPLDISALAAAIGATRGVADITTRIKASERELTEADAAISDRLMSLRPKASSENELVRMSIPPRNVVKTRRDSLRDSERMAESCRDRIKGVEKELEQHRTALEQLSHDGDVVAPDELDRARKERDTGWSLIRRHYIDGDKVPEQEIVAFSADVADLPITFEKKVATADELADRRFNKAEAAGQIAVVARQVAETEKELQSLHDEEKGIEERLRELDAQWRELWSEASFAPLDPEFMLDWLDARIGIIDLVEKRAAAERRVKALQDEEAEAREALVSALTELNQDTKGLEGQSLRVVLEAAEAIQRRHENLSERKATAEEQIRKLRADETRKKEKMEKAQDAWSEWVGQWSPALNTLAFDEDMAPEIVSDQLEIIDEMRGLSNDIDQLKRERIAKIELDIKGFSDSVTSLLKAVATDLKNQEPEDAVLQLEQRLDAAKRVKGLKSEKDKVIESLNNRIGECDQDRMIAQRLIEKLQELSHVDSPDRLTEVLRVADHRRELEVEKKTLEGTLTEEGDGLPLTELRAECDGVDLDQIAAREESLQSELKELRERLTPAAEVRAKARQTFETIGGDGGAARAAAARQEALASMGDVAERYVRVRTAGTLLRWAIDRYRREKQAPLLTRAGEMFETLTLGSFTELRVQYDDKDNARLGGIRQDGSSVSSGGMSDGAADQLYLALRLASVEEYLSHAHALPFVSDDLLINFDDDRAAAGFRVLSELSQKTQILFFTHHKHLVDIARKTLGGNINVISLT